MKRKIAENIEKAVNLLQKNKGLPDFDMPKIEIDYPKEEKFGDYSTNVAMILGKKLSKNPIKIASQIVEFLNSQVAEGLKKYFKEIKVATPGYINFCLSEKYLQDKILEINSKGNNFGESKIGKGVKINNEFISANPTGPLHLGNGRGGFYGDSLSKVLRKAGYEVVNEYYVNDAGGQVLKLGHSVLKDSEAVYSGEYIDYVINKINKNESFPVIGSSASDIILSDFIKPTILEKMKITIDKYIHEKKDLVDKGYVEQAIDLLKEKKLTYESEDALWLKTTKFGDDKDRVLIKNNGQKSYFASDCGYILNKIERGFEKIIETWGADHHGYVNRFRAAAEALGFSEENIKFIIVQLVRLVQNGKEVRMSKRAGNVIYIDELIDEVGHDVARFFFLMYSPDTHMNFDLGLAKERSEKNPVYYVQYAYARICSILAKVKSQKSKVKNLDLFLITHEKELSLIKELNKFPELIEEISQSYAVHKLPHYAIKLADKFHSFYNDCKVIDEDNLGLTQARLEVVKAVKIVLEETLNLIGVGAPEKM